MTRYFTKNGVSLNPRERERIKNCPKNWDLLLYGAKHNLIRKIYGTKKKCEMCGRTENKYKVETKPTRFEWANIDHKYKINRKYWKRVCRQCHAILDSRILKNKHIYE